MTEAQRRLGLIERNRNESIAVTTSRRFVPHPRGFNGFLRPQDDYGVGYLECFLDHLLKLGTPAHVGVPPDGVTLLLKRECEQARLAGIRSGVTEEDLRHATFLRGLMLRRKPWASMMKQAKDDGRLPMEDHNTRIIVFGSNAGDARAVADAIASEAFHNVSFVAEPIEQVQRAMR